MKLDSAISHQVLDRIKGSSGKLVTAISQQGEDRCYKGDPLAQLVAAEAVVAPPRLEAVIGRKV